MLELQLRKSPAYFAGRHARGIQATARANRWASIASMFSVSLGPNAACKPSPAC